MRYILLLNDGTDEIYNLNDIILKSDSLSEFESELQILFPGMDLDEIKLSTYFLEVPNKEICTYFYNLSNKAGDLTKLEEYILEKLLQDKFLPWEEFRKSFIFSEDLKFDFDPKRIPEHRALLLRLIFDYKEDQFEDLRDNIETDPKYFEEHYLNNILIPLKNLGVTDLDSLNKFLTQIQKDYGSILENPIPYLSIYLP